MYHEARHRRRISAEISSFHKRDACWLTIIGKMARKPFVPRRYSLGRGRRAERRDCATGNSDLMNRSDRRQGTLRSGKSDTIRPSIGWGKNETKTEYCRSHNCSTRFSFVIEWRMYPRGLADRGIGLACGLRKESLIIHPRRLSRPLQCCRASSRRTLEFDG